ncbi:MAG: hypothetical protein IPK87_12680 [Planctomycetes bacterium]|nr:hypothetical protein [Planctomycetota bacterium]
MRVTFNLVLLAVALALVPALAAQSGDEKAALSADTYTMGGLRLLWRSQFGVLGAELEYRILVPRSADEAALIVTGPDDISWAATHAATGIRYVEAHEITAQTLHKLPESIRIGVTHLSINRSSIGAAELEQLQQSFPALRGLMLEVTWPIDKLALRALRAFTGVQELSLHVTWGEDIDVAVDPMTALLAFKGAQRLDLGCDLSFWHADWALQFSSLEWLRVAGATKLPHGHFWDSLSLLPELHYLNVGFQSCSGWSAERINLLKKNKHLEGLTLSGSCDENPAELFQSFASLPRLAYLILPSTVGEKWDDAFSLLSGKRFKALGVAEFSPKIAQFLMSQTALTDLAVHFNDNEGRTGDINTLLACTNLRVLWLDYFKSDPAALATLTADLPITDLHFSGGKLGDRMMPFVARCPKLEVLILNHRVTSTAKCWETFGKLKSLRVLTIPIREVEGLADLMSALESLEVLGDPTGAAWTKAIETALARLPAIRVIVACGVSEAAAERLKAKKKNVRICDHLPQYGSRPK